MLKISALAACVSALALLAASATAADMPAIGAWNAGAQKVAEGSPLATSALAFIKAELAKISDEAMRKATEDAVFNADSCIKHRANLDDAKKQTILDKLKAEGVIDEAEASRIPGGLLAGIFPPVREDGTACPKLPQPYIASPGSAFGGHHSQPGGLAEHVAVNLTSALNLAETYRKVYGTNDAEGRAVMHSGKAGEVADKAFFIDQNIVIAAPIWHDWAKTIVFQWNADGSEFPEMNFGGNGKTDAWGTPGSTKTGAHHILGIAEAMARDLPAAEIITHASAHAAPNAGAEYNAVNWIRTAAIISGVDPVAKGYLKMDALNRLRLAPQRKGGSVDIQASLPNQPHMLYEYVLHNLSDADYTYTGTATAQSDLLLRLLAPKFSFDAAEATKYNTKFRNIILSHLGAERVHITYVNGGLEAVEKEVAALKAAKIID